MINTYKSRQLQIVELPYENDAGFHRLICKLRYARILGYWIFNCLSFFSISIFSFFFVILSNAESHFAQELYA